MRIFYASGEIPNAALNKSQVWRNNLLLALTDLGHDVVEFKYNLEPLIQNANINNPAQFAFVQKNRPVAQAELIDQIRIAHNYKPVDLFFSYLYSSCVTQDAIREIRSLGIVTMNWYCNASYQIDLVSDIAPAYDYCLVPEKYRLEDYRNLGANPIYCQEAANPKIYKPFNLEKDHDVVFIGAKYADRAFYINRLFEAGVNVRAYGPGWRKTITRRNFKNYFSLQGLRNMLGRIKRVVKSTGQPEITFPKNVTGKVLSDEEMVIMYSRSKIVLGFSTVNKTYLGDERIVQIRLRDFEVPMSGGFYMVEYMEELEEFFDIGREIVCYKDADDLVEKVKYFLRHDEEREKIRHAGYLRAVRDHSWQKRFTDVFEQIGLK